MKRLLLAALVLGAAFLAYRRFAPDEPVRTYRRFAEAWARSRYEDAARLSEGEAVSRALGRQSVSNLFGGPWIETLHGMRLTIESREEKENGDVSIEARQLLFFDPPGITSGLGGAMYASFRHSATLKKTPDGWKLTAFEAKLLEAGPMRRR